jgi:adenylosuccinate synthase
MPGLIVVGVQWGDEGKGKVIDLLSEQADCVVRAQGGNNAGHTIIVDNQEYKFHLIPSGALYPKAKCYVTGGTVIDPAVLVKEIKGLEANGIHLKNRLFISGYAHMVMPYHRILDKMYEEQKGPLAIGTTGKGIGPCYSDKATRIGIQIGELRHPEAFSAHLEQALRIKNNEMHALFKMEGLAHQDIFQEYLTYAQFLEPYLSDTVEMEIADAIDQGKKVLFEGAHGTFLDQTFGTYPYVTSSSTLASGVACGAGVGPTRIHHVVGVVKAYTTRVGNGPLPTALTKEEAGVFMNNVDAREVGTTTGRNRRLGWFDAVLVKTAIRLNGVDSMAVMKLDILDCLSEIKICTGYQLNGKKLDALPALTSDWENMVPLYETMPGWKESTKDIRRIEDLPKNARAYVERIQQLCNCPVSILSFGPERDKTLHLRQIFDR